jgi:hypothetical protein
LGGGVNHDDDENNEESHHDDGHDSACHTGKVGHVREKSGTLAALFDGLSRLPAEVQTRERVSTGHRDARRTERGGVVGQPEEVVGDRVITA